MPKGFEDVLVVQYQRAKIVQEKKDAYLEFVFDGHPSKFKISKSNVSSQELQTLLEDKLADFCQQIAINQEVAFLEEFTRLYQKGYPIDQLDLAGINTEAYVGFLSVQGFKQELLSSENAEDLYFDYLASLPSQALQLEEVSAELSALVELTLQAKIGYPVEWLAEQAKTLDEAIIAFYLKNFAEFDREKLQDEDASEISGGGKDYKVFCQLLNKLSKTYAAKSSRVPTAWEIEYDGVVSYKLITGDEVESFSTSDELSGEIARQTNNHWLLQTEDQVSYWILHKGWFSSKLASYSLERFVAEVQAKEKQEAASRRRWAIGLGLSTTFAGVQDLFASAFYGRRGVAEDNFDFIGEESVTISSGALALPSGAGYVQRESTSQSNSSQLLSSIVNYKSSVDFLSFPNSFHQLTNYAINSLVPFVAMRKMGLSSSVSLFVSGVFGALKTVSGGVTNTTVTLQFDAPTAAPVRISIENSTMGITFAPSTGMAITDVKDLPYGLSISTPLVSTSIKLISNVQAMNYLSDYLLIGTSGGSISCYNLTTLTVAKSFPVSGAVYEFSQLPGSSILWIAGASGLYAWNISGTPTSVGSYAGNLIGAVAVNNGLVYAADGLSTNLVRIISQTTITQVRSITIPSGTIKQLCALNNNALAVAASTAGVYLYANVDSSPTLAATILVPSAISVGSYGNYLFIVDTSGLFYVVDIASLSAPRIIYFSSGIFSGRTLYVTSDGAMVYVTQANGVVNFYSIVDLPRVTFVGQRSVPDLVLKMAATPTQTLVTLGQGLLGIRKDNYSQRVVKGDLIQAQFNLGTLQTVRSVTVSGTPQQIVKVGANYFVASQGTGLLIYDSNWTLLGSFSATGVKSLAVLPTGNTVIIANGSSGAQIINTTNKASPALISTITPGTRNFQSVAISPTNSNYIALADSSGSVVVYSIATLASPSQVSSTAVAGSNFHAIGFASDGTTVYAAGNGSISGGLNYKGPLVEITNALTATPTLARTSYMPYGGESLAITSDQQYILVAGSVNGGLLVFSRQTLKVVASSLLNTTARGVAVCGTTTSPAGYFFALATDAGTYVFFFDPAAQSLTQVADLNNAAKSLLMDGAQLITGGTGIQAFDLSQQSVSLNPMFNTSVSVYGSDGAQQEEDQPIWIMPTPAYQAPASNQPYQLGIASSISAGQITQGVGVTANISFSDSNAVISVPSYPDVTVIISPGQLTATSNVYGVANLNALLANIQVTSAAASLTASCSFTDQVHTVIQSNVSFSPQHTLFLNANSGFSSVYSGNTNTFANLGSINSPATQATVVISIPAAQMTAANVTVFTTTAASGATVTYQSGSITITGTPSAVNATLANGITLRANNIDFAGALSLNMTAADNINGSGYQVTSATSVSLQALPNTVPAYSGGYSVPNIVAGNSVTINLAALFSSADGRPVTLSVNLSNFPAGMASYNASTGLLTVSTQALIQQAGTYNFAVTATNGNQQLTQTFQANVQPPPYATPVWSSTITTKTKVAGSAESFSLGTVTSSDGRTSTYSLAVLDQSNQPVSGTWYSINSTTGVVSLTSSLPAGSYTLRVTAQNGSASATSDLNLTVMPALTAAVAPSVSLQQAAVGTAFSFTVPAFTSITSGATTTDGFTNLPTGWSYNASTRVLTGTPTKTMSMLALTEAFTVSRTNPETNQLESFTTNLTLNLQVQPSLAISNFAQTVSGGISTQALSVVNNTLAITTPASNLTAILQANVSASLQLTASGAAVVTQPSAGVYQVTGPKADVIAALKTLKAQVSNVDFAGDVAISATIQDGVNNDITQTITAQFQPLPYATPVWSNTSLTTKTKVAGSTESFSLGTVTSSDGRTSTYSLVVLDQGSQPVSGTWYSINSTTGVISLTSALPAGNYTLRVTAQNGSASATSDLNLTVMPVLAAAIAPSISLQQAAVGTAFSFTVPAFTSITSGATTTDSFTNLPTGWSYNASTRVLTGTPTKTMSTLALTEAFTVSRTNPETNQLESFTTNLTLNVQVQPSLAMSDFAQTVSGGISTQALSVVNNTLAITTPASNLTAILQVSTSSASLQLTASGAAVITQPSAGVYQVTGPKADVIATLKTLKAQVSNVDFAGDVAISATIQDGVNNDVTQTITAQFQPLPYATPVWSNTSLTTKTKVAGSAESFSLGTVTSSDGRTSTYSLVVLDQGSQPVSGTWYSINSTTGVISLTSALPAGNYTLRVTAQNGNAFATSDLNLTVVPALTAAVAPSMLAQQASVGEVFSFAVPSFTNIVSGATVNDSFAHLPAGWSYDASTRVLTGIPTKVMSTLALTEAFTVSRVNPESNQLESSTTNLTFNVQVQPSLAVNNLAQTVNGGVSTQALSVVNNTLAITTPASNLTVILQASTSTASLQLTASGAAVISQPSAGIYQVTGSKADVVATLKTLKAQVSDVDFAGDVAISATVQDELNTDITQTITAQFQPLPYVTPVWSNTSLTTKTKVAGSAESFSLGTVTSSDGRASTYSLAVLDQSSQSVPGNWYNINSVTGVISLTSALPKGNYRLVATAHNGDQVAEATLDLTVVPILTAAVAPSISQQQASVGIPYSFTIPEFMDITAGATVVYSMPNLPQGWEFNPDTRELTGTPISDMSALSLEMTATVNRINPETNQTESLTSQASMSVQVTPSLSLGSSQKSFTGVSGTIASCPQSFSIQTPAPQVVVDLHISVEQIQAADIHDFNCTAVGNASVSKQETIYGTSLIITGSLEEVNAILEQGYQLKASNIDYEGDISITVTVRDTLNKEAVSTTTALTLTEYPRATPQWLNTITTKTKIEGNSEVLSLGNATLTDGRQPSYSLRVYRKQTQALMNVAWCTIDSQTGDVSFTTDIPEGDYLIEVTAHNAQVESKTSTSLTVWPNLIPAEAPALEVQEINVGESFEIQLAGFNYHSPGASISYSIENLPSDWVFDAQQLRLRGKPGKEMLHKVPQPRIVAKLSRENPETGDLESFDTATVVPLSVAPSLLVMPIVQNLNGTAGILLSPQPLVISSPASLVNVTLQLSANTSSASLELHASRSTRLTYHLEGSPEVVSEYLSQLKVRIDDIDYEGPLNVALFVDDGINYPLQGNLTAQIQAFPDATPQLVTNTDLSTLVIQAGKAITVPIPSFTVADGRPITYEVTLLKDGVVINPAWFSVDYAQGLIHFAPDAGLSGSLSIRTIARNRSKQSECSRGSFVFNLSYFLAGLAAFATAGGCLTGIFYLLCRKKKLKPIDEWGVKLKAGEERFIALDKVLLVEKNILETGKAEDRKSVFMLDTPSHLPDKVKITFNGNIIHIDTKGSIQAIGDYAINLTEYSPSGEYRFSYPLPITVTEPDFAQPVWSDVQCQLRDLVIRAGETWSANIGIASCADDRGLTYDYHVASTAEKQAAINFDPLSGDFMLAVPEKRGYEGEYEITVRAVNAQNDRFYAERKIFILVRPAIFSRPVWTAEALAAQVLQAGNRCTLYVGKASASDERPLKYKIVTNPSLKEGTFITEYNADTGEIGISAKGTIDQQANYEVTVYAINGDVWEPKSFPLVVTEPAFARPEWQADADALLPAKNHKIESNASVFDLRYFVAACGREVEVDCQFLPGPCVSYERTMKRLVISPAKTVEEAGEYRVKIIAKNGPEVVVYEVSFAVIVPPPEKPVFIGTSFYEIVAGENLDIHLPATIFQTRDGRKPSLMIDFSAAAKKLSIVKDDEFIHVNTKAIKQQAGRYAIYVMAINEGVETIQNITVLVQKPPYAKPELEDKHALLSQEVVVHGKEKMLTIPRFFVSDGRQKELRYEIKLLLASTRIEVQPDWFEFDRKTGQIKLLPHATHEKFIIQIEARNGNASTVVEYGLQISRPMHPHVATQMEYPAFNDSPYMTEAVELRREYEGAFGDRIPLPGLSPRFQEHSRQEMDKTEELMLLHGKSSRLSSRVSSRAQRRALPLLRKLESRLLPPEQLFSVTPGAADTSHTPTLFQNEEEDLLQGLYVPFEEAAGVAPPVQSQPGHSPSLPGLRNSLPSSDSSPRSLPPGLSPVGSPTATFFSRRPIERDRLPPLQLQSLPPVAALRPSDSLFKKVDEPSNAPVQTLSLQDREVRDAWENLKVLSEKARLLMRQLNIG